MENNKYEIALKIIADAGDSRSDSIQAIAKAQAGAFDCAQELLKSAQEKMQKAHHYQFELITREANGEVLNINLILVHAEDHLSMSVMMLDVARSFIDHCKQIKELKDFVGYNTKELHL